jgi:sirohydrochlorin cobaltochelatase
VAAPAKNAILLAAFGSRLPGASDSLKAMQARAQELYPDFRVETALTSGVVRRHKAAVGSRHGRSPEDILRGLREEGVTRLAVQSLHVVPGDEFLALERLAASMQGGQGAGGGGFERVTVGRPLLGNGEDIRRAARAILAMLPADRAPGEAALLMGHGTKGRANGVYRDLERELRALDRRVLIGALEAEPGLAAKVGELKALEVSRVHLLPLLFARGVHVTRDMAGEGAGEGGDSWRAGLCAAGFDCVPHLKGAGEHAQLADIWLDHLREAVDRLLA